MSGHCYTAERDLNAAPNLAGLGRPSSRNAFYGAPGLQGSVQPEKKMPATNPHLNQMTTRAGSQSDASLLIRHRPCHDPLTLGTARVHARAHSDSFTPRPTRCQTQSRSATRAVPPMLRRAHDQPQIRQRPTHAQTHSCPSQLTSRLVRAQTQHTLAPRRGESALGLGANVPGSLRNKRTQF